MNDRRIDHRTLAQHQTSITQIAIDDLQNPACQLMLFQQAPEIENRGFIGDSIQTRPCELAQDRCLVKCFLHRRIAVTKPVLHQVNPQHRHQRIGRTANLRPSDNEAQSGRSSLSRAPPDPLDQKALAAGLLTFTRVLGIGEGHLISPGVSAVEIRRSAKFGDPLQSFS